MNKRAIYTGLTLLLVGGCIKATNTGYSMKVAQVNHSIGLIEVKFIVVPDDLRLICHGNTKQYNTGDFVKIETANGDVHFGDIKCNAVRWDK